MSRIIEYIQEKLKENSIDLSLIQKEIKEIKSKYPKEKFLSMKIDEWVKLGDQYCFINMIENKTNHVASGFLGFNRNRLFYQGKKDSKPLIVKAISREKRFAGMTDEEIFSRYMKEIYTFIITFDPNNYVASEYLYGANVIKAKIAMIYCEGYKICGFTSRTHALKMADYLGIYVDKSDDTLGINIKINKFLIDKEPELNEVNSYILGRIIWDFYVEFVKLNKKGNTEYLMIDRRTDTNFITAIEDVKLTKDIYLGPKPAPEAHKEKGASKYPRNLEISKYALKEAKYLCECGKDHPSFKRKSDGKNYTEPHHIIPISAQGNFNISLDCLPNIISLCSTCHNRLHYGEEIEHMLKEIYNKRIDALRKFGINITYEELLSYYK